MTIKMKLLGSAISVSLLLFAILGVTIFYFNNLDRGFQEIVDTSSRGKSQSQTSDKTVGLVKSELTVMSLRMKETSDTVTKSNMFVQLTARKIKKLSDDLNDITAMVEETYAGLAEGDTKDSLQYIVDDISDIQERMKREALIGLDRSVKQLQQSTDEIAQASRKTMQLTGKLDRSKELSHSVRQINAEIQKKSLGFKETIARNRSTLTVIIIISALVSLLFGFIFSKSITTPLNEAVNFAKMIAHGDFTQQIKLKQKDEIGALIVSLNTMSGNLQGMFQNVGQCVQTLITSANEFSSVSQQIISNSKLTAGRSNVVANASDEMSNNMSSIAAASEQATTNIKTIVAAAEELSESIRKIVDRTADGSQTTGHAVNKAEEISLKVADLGRAASKIGEVTETIKEISEQTNLLALNATIEAARAGDAGKGFAVVANEIKILAQRTSESVNEINERISGVQNTTLESVSVIEEVVLLINEINHVVSNIATSLSEQSLTTSDISNNVGQAALGLQEINENINRNSTVTENVTLEISELNQAIQENNVISSQVNASTIKLSAMANDLDEMVNQFKTEPEVVNL